MRKTGRYEVLRAAITLHSLHGILVLYHHFPCYYFSADDVDKINARWQVAHVDGGRAFHAEATYFGTLGVNDDDTGAALVIIRGDGHLERLCIYIRQFRDFRQDIGVVAISHQLGRNP